MSKDPNATAWLDAIEIKALPKREVPDTARILTQVNGATIWQEDENRKIFLDSDLPGKEADGPVRMDLAQGEYGSFQIAVTPDEALHQIGWTWADFPVHAPIGQDLGIYQNTLVLRSRDEELCRVVVEIRVRDFALPQKPSIDVHKMPADEKWKGQEIFANAELTKLEPRFETLFTDYMNQLVSAMKAADLFHEPILRFIDEPDLDDATTINGIHSIATLLKGIDPAITVSLTATRPQPELTDVIKLWTLHTDAWDRILPLITAAREKGCRISVYNNGVNYPENSPIRIRLWPWPLKKYDVDGSYSWWGTVCWRGDVEKPWTSGKITSGVLLYPPRDESEHGPIETVRWELFRQGLQDYEYLHLAEHLAEGLEAEGKVDLAKVGREAVQQALSLVERWPRVRPANDHPYTLDVTKLAAAKAALADAIEAMQR